ncbi:glycosyltransferase [Geomonas oryzisoli]|uniref:Glycosyltransferase n=1 Tax=Geomonas oryzisoli TaxID=2847992 RepID=A0ABX8J6Q4_9BACT|nr:glycosyltransferase [Geomonas oryzisoli]QWV92761.1 glycosyltransferase [Geomonas oryzisoli]
MSRTDSEDDQQPVRVLHVLHDSRRSGVPAVAANLILALDRSTVTASALFAYEGIYSEELRARGVQVWSMGKRVPFLWRLNRFLMNFKLATLLGSFDVVHAHSVKCALHVIVAKALGATVIYHLHELPRTVGPLLRRAIATADCVVFCSNTCAAHYSAVPARSRRVLVNAVDPASFPPVVETPRRRIVMVASINKGKGQNLLLEAFSKLTQKDVELYFYGTTGLSAHGYVAGLKREVQTRGLAGRVFFPGPTADIRSVLKESTLLVHTSWKESFGMALVEAMASGVPVIAQDLEGMREVVVDGVTGYLVPPGDVEGLSGRISKLLDDPSLRSRFGAAGRALVQEKYNMESRVPEYVELCRDLYAGREMR